MRIRNKQLKIIRSYSKRLKPLYREVKLADSIAFHPAVELSYLSKEEQRPLYETMLQEERTPSLSQAQRMKKLSQESGLDERTMERILAEDKPNQREQIRLPASRIDRFFPKGYTPKQKEDTIIKLLADWQRKRERYKNEQERER